MTRTQSVGLAALVIALAAACKSAAGPESTKAVDIRLAVAQGGGFSARSLTASGGAGLEISSIRIVVGEVSLGSGDEFGCVDCQGDDESGPGPRLVSVPVDGGSVLVQTEQVRPGLYPEAEISVDSPTTEVLAGSPGWSAGATIEIAGQLNGAPFEISSQATGSIRTTLSPPVQVTDAAVPEEISVTIRLPLMDWFAPAGTILDPNDSAQQALILENIRAFLAIEKD